MDETNPIEKPRLGLSTCLLGENVRYDGGHKLNRFIRDELGRFVDFVPVCPEVECGLPIPRESMRLEGDPDNPRLMTARSRKDITPRMLEWAKGRLDELEPKDLSGFIFKSKSPSSGLMRVKVYGKNNIPRKIGVGIFARAFTERFPLLPAEEDGRLNDPVIRENFIERIFAYQRWRTLLAGRRTRGALVEFHTRHKYFLLAHSPKHTREMGKLLAAARDHTTPDLYAGYQDLFLAALALHTTVRKNTNVLQHMAGYFKRVLSADERAELKEIIERYHAGHVPLIVPVTIINHFVRKYEEPYLGRQWYLNPHPIELQLRNHP